MPDITLRFAPAQREALLELVTYGLAALADRKIEPRAVDLEAVRKLREAGEPDGEAMKDEQAYWLTDDERDAVVRVLHEFGAHVAPLDADAKAALSKLVDKGPVPDGELSCYDPNETRPDDYYRRHAP